MEDSEISFVSIRQRYTNIGCCVAHHCVGWGEKEVRCADKRSKQYVAVTKPTYKSCTTLLPRANAVQQWATRRFDYFWTHTHTPRDKTVFSKFLSKKP